MTPPAVWLWFACALVIPAPFEFVLLFASLARQILCGSISAQSSWNEGPVESSGPMLHDTAILVAVPFYFTMRRFRRLDRCRRPQQTYSCYIIRGLRPVADRRWPYFPHFSER